MNNSWFRMYHEFATDPKIQMLSETDQRRFVMLLCQRCSNGDVTLHDEEVAFQLRISNEEWRETKRIFVDKKLIDSSNKVLNWEKRQFLSDSSTARVARHRERKKTQLKRQCNVTVTPPDTDTDTDTEKDIKKNKQKKSALDFTNWPELPSAEVYADWLALRQKKRAPVSQTVINNFGSQLRVARGYGFTVDQCLAQCIVSGWQGFQASWMLGREQPAHRVFTPNATKPVQKTSNIPLAEQINDRSWASELIEHDSGDDGNYADDDKNYKLSD